MRVPVPGVGCPCGAADAAPSEVKSVHISWQPPAFRPDLPRSFETAQDSTHSRHQWHNYLPLLARSRSTSDARPEARRGAARVAGRGAALGVRAHPDSAEPRRAGQDSRSLLGAFQGDLTRPRLRHWSWAGAMARSR